LQKKTTILPKQTSLLGFFIKIPKRRYFILTCDMMEATDKIDKEKTVRQKTNLSYCSPYRYSLS